MDEDDLHLVIVCCEKNMVVLVDLTTEHATPMIVSENRGVLHAVSSTAPSQKSSPQGVSGLGLRFVVWGMT